MNGIKTFEKHLYHPTLPPLVVYTQADVDKAEAQGYSETYVPQEYPKFLGYNAFGRDIIAQNAAEEAALQGGTETQEEK